MGEAAVVKAFLGAMRRRRPLAMLRLAVPDVVLVLPAESPRIGAREHRGRWTVVRATARITWLSRGTLRIEPESFSVVDRRVEVDARVTARRGGVRLDHRMRCWRSFLTYFHQTKVRQDGTTRFGSGRPPIDAVNAARRG